VASGNIAFEDEGMRGGGGNERRGEERERGRGEERGREGKRIGEERKGGCEGVKKW
jgi:hypothetical protein